MVLQKATTDDFERVRNFYWNLIDEMRGQTNTVGWKKGIYPSDAFLKESLEKGELFVFIKDELLCACVILNSSCNDGYNDVAWKHNYLSDEILIPHALGVSPCMQKQGIGTILVNEILQFAKQTNKKAVRLDLLGGNIAAERLYTKCGFQFVETKTMYYEDTGWTEFRLYEQNLF